MKHALIRFSFVPVWPRVLLQISFMPANFKILAHSFSTFRPVPLGAGYNTIIALPHLPSTLNGIVCASPQPHNQLPQPRLILITFNLALRNAFSLAGTV